METKIKLLQKQMAALMKRIKQVDDRLNKMSSNNSVWVDTAEMTRIFNVSAKTLRHYWNMGYISRSRMGKVGRIFYKPADMYEYLDKNSERKGGRS